MLVPVGRYYNYIIWIQKIFILFFIYEQEKES